MQQRVETFEKNADRQGRRAKLWGSSLASLTAGLVLAVVAIVCRLSTRDGADQRQRSPGRGVGPAPAS